MNEVRPFNFAEYREILRALKQGSYKFLDYCQAASLTLPMETRGVLLRHDIDKSMTKAVRFAEIEHEEGVRATYFVRLHSNYYNPFGHLCYRQLSKILSLGHEVGLHTEFWDFARISGKSEQNVFRRERIVLEAIIEREVRVCSLHRTSGSTDMQTLYEKFQAILAEESLIHANSAFYSEHFKYLSDSGGVWREGPFIDQIGKYPRMQVLTHPIWWYEEHIELEEPAV